MPTLSTLLIAKMSRASVSRYAVPRGQYREPDTLSVASGVSSAAASSVARSFSYGAADYIEEKFERNGGAIITNMD